MTIKHLLSDLEVSSAGDADSEGVSVPEARHGSIVLMKSLEEGLHVTSLSYVLQITHHFISLLETRNLLDS